jgi:hypothetical protein
MKFNYILLSVLLCILGLSNKFFSAPLFARVSDEQRSLAVRHRGEMQELQKRQREEMRTLREQERQQRRELRDKKREDAYDDLKNLFFNAIAKGRKFSGNVSICIKRGKKTIEYRNNNGIITKTGLKRNKALEDMIEYMLQKDTSFSGVGRMNFYAKKKKSCVKANYKNKDGAVEIHYRVSGKDSGYSLHTNEYSSTSVRGEMRSYWRASMNWLKSWLE